MRNVGFQPAEPLEVWCVTDGRAGIENQALGLAEAIARRTPADILMKRVRLRTPWSWAPVSLVPNPKLTTTLESDPLTAPWPDIWIGCGRASLPFSMNVRQWSNDRTLVVQLQDPRVNPREFDVVIPPVHDQLEGPNIFPIIGACHRVTPERLEEAKQDYPTALDDLPAPRFAFLIGGKSKRQDITGPRAREIAELAVSLQRMTGGALMTTLSRRTGAAARAQFRARLAPHCDVFFEGEGLNPYFAMLASAHFVFVTADSVNMATEAAATGKPVYILAVDGRAGKIDRFHKSLVERGCARPFNGQIESWAYNPLLETDRAAAAVLSLWSTRALPR